MAWVTVDGNEAAARVAHALSEVIAIYPITPASPMGELADEWSAAGRTNLWGEVPEVVEMQSEAGAAGVLHGAVLKGALGTTFTSSQGLLLMLPNMFKIAGELTPAVIHVAARAVATHALSIFGDHSDVMAARATGWAMLAAADVQEAHDFALIAHAASLRGRVPFLHFFDGFRTSHEVAKIWALSEADLRALVREQDIIAHRQRGLSPDHPTLRGSAQNPDVFFQSREAANPWYDALPTIVQHTMDELCERTGRTYHLVDYAGAPDAERVLIIMGSGAGAVSETVDELVRRGEKVGMVTVRLYRPFPAEALARALPASVKRVAVLDRCKEPGAVGDPLYLDVIAALTEQRRGGVDVTGARYGLAGKEFTPPMVKGLLDELGRTAPRRHATVGIIDDLMGTSIAPDPSFKVPARAVQAVFFGLGSDGTVGANKAGIKIIGEHTDLHAQGYFVYDSKKSGSVTVSHLRFGPDPIRSTYLVDGADFVACHQFGLLARQKVLDVARPGATFLLNSPYHADEVWSRLPSGVQRQIVDKELDCYVIDAHRVAREVGLGGRINTVMQPCFFALSGVLPRAQALTALKDSIAQTYGRRGPEVVARNHAAVDRALESLRPLPVRAPSPARPPVPSDLMAKLIAGEGDLLPVSVLPADGTFPTGTAKLEKRALALELPVWEPDGCTDCGKCVIACPHAALRMKVCDPSDLDDASDGFLSKDYGGRELRGKKLTIQVAPDDCTGCGICVDVCPTTPKVLSLAPAEPMRDAQRPRWEFFERLPELDPAAARRDTVKGSQLLQPLFEFSGACSGCGETPYLKLLTQLFGDRLVVANATGCTSIFGGNLPTTPWSVNAAGRGPAWANSLFEDNAEFGLGLRLAHERHASEARRLVSAMGSPLAKSILDAEQDSEAGIAAQRDRVAALKAGLVPGDRLLSVADELVRKSFWIVGGDGWAYDIGFGGLDHLLSSGRDVNILVLDTEVYSNTGGQASKATPRGASAKFSVAGKPTAKKDLGKLARTYDNVYVAQVALGANEMQTVRALLEAEAFPGPALVIAYSTCIAHGIDMATSMTHQKDAVACGFWPLYRARPGGIRVDGKRTGLTVAEFARTESRFAGLARTHPERAASLLDQHQADVDRRWDALGAGTA